MFVIFLNKKKIEFYGKNIKNIIIFIEDFLNVYFMGQKIGCLLMPF